MTNRKGLDTLEIAVHVIIILVGILVLVFAHRVSNIFWQSLMINIGSSLVVVTILFIIFEVFRKRNEKDEESENPRFHGQSQRLQNERADKLIDQLRSSQYFPVTSNSRKTHNNSHRSK